MSLESPLRLLGFVLAYLGAAWSNAPVGAAIGGACGLLAAVLLIVYLRNAQRSRALFFLILLTLLFCIGTALLTAFARLHMGLEQALAPRYQTPVLLFWGEVALLLLLAVDGMRGSPYLRPVFALCVLIIFVRGGYHAVYPIRQARWHGFQVNAAGAALMTGVDDPYQFYLGAVDADHRVKDVAYLEQKRLSVFASDLYQQLNRPLASVFKVAPSEYCTGALQTLSVLTVESDVAGLRLSGWAWDFSHKMPASYIVVVIDGRIVGFGAMGDWRPTIRAANGYMNSSFIGFTAYSQIRRPAPIAIYAILAGAPPQACQVATTQP